MIPWKAACVERTDCRAGGGKLIEVLDLGDFSLSGFVKPGDTQSEKYPLKLCFADDSGLVQLQHSVDPELMYRKYWYRSATNESMRAHLRDLANDIQERINLPSGAVILDIGCNDGTLLTEFPEQYWRVGFDPSKIEPSGGVDVFVNDFFSAKRYKAEELGRATVVTTIAMFYDLDDPVAFSKEVASVLSDDGLWVIEMHYLPAMLRMNAFDAICHEHLCYYSLRSLEFVLHQAGLKVIDVALNQVNGGSFRAYVQKHGEPTAMVETLRDSEQVLDFEAFARNIDINRRMLIAMLEAMQSMGKKVLGYGASTKGNTMLQYYGITPELLPAIADRNPDKHGLMTAGTNIPIISEDEARAMKPDFFLALPYHFVNGFVGRELDFVIRGGKFIVPMPFPYFVGRQLV